MASRWLWQDEKTELKNVYGASLDTNSLLISDVLDGQDYAMTLAGQNWNEGGRWVYVICWSAAIFQKGAVTPNTRSSLIHEGAHCWQGQHGTHPTFYMARSVFSQLYEGIRDLVKVGEWRGWSEHRSKTYLFNWNEIGKNWNEFNVEQQASIVESWYQDENNRQYYINTGGYFGEGVFGGGASPYDSRYPYIQDVVLTGNQNAVYKAITLPKGADKEVKRIQDMLVALNYLEARFADGIVSRGNSPTIQAIRAFQSNNALAVDGDLGGPNSNTRARLRLPISQLKGAVARR
jgi:Putative peptidoglycan binding domain